MKAAALFPRDSIRRQLLLGVLLIGLPPMAVLFYQNYYALSVLRAKAGESYMNAVSLRLEQIDGTLGAVDRHLRALADSDADLLTMAESDDENAYRLAKNRLGRRLTESTLTHPLAELFFVFCPERDDALEVFSAGGSFADRMRMRDVVRGGVIIGPPGFDKEREWRVVLIGDAWFLIRAIRAGRIVVGAWCRLERLLQTARAFSDQEGTTILFTNEYGESMTASSPPVFAAIDAIGVHERASPGPHPRRHLVVGAASSIAPIRLHAIIDDRYVVRRLPFFRWVFISITALSAVFFAVAALVMLRRTIILPLDRMLGAIARIRAGDAAGRVVPAPRTVEFRRVTEAFNSMTAEIDELRISVYEEQLAMHREELLRLKAQVDPHFFLNSINMVYSLLARGDHDRVSEAMLLLSKYFGFSVRSGADLIPLGEEFEHIGDYVRIQQLRFNDLPRLRIDAPDFLLEQPVPPLIVQTFVENSFRHGLTRGDAFAVSVEADYEERDGAEYLAVYVRDNGPGFDGGYLSAFPETNRRDEACDHIGIKNAQRRLALMYKGKARIELGNLSDGDRTNGAWAKIVIPFAENGNPTGEAAS